MGTIVSFAGLDPSSSKPLACTGTDAHINTNTSILATKFASLVIGPNQRSYIASHKIGSVGWNLVHRIG